MSYQWLERAGMIEGTYDGDGTEVEVDKVPSL